ncbi:MAG: hypothetical protein DDT38_00706 [Firmicutes bacterium]|nr:hypothetical protein [candidate division NPL-UPA2 bacterium]
MGNCRHCLKPAGFLRSVHRECQEKHNAGRAEILSLVRKTLKEHSALAGLRATTTQMAAESFVDAASTRALVVEGYTQAVEDALADGLLSDEEEDNLVLLEGEFSLTQTELDQKGAYTKVVQAHVLRELANGKLPDKFNVTGSLPFNMQRDEKLVWLFQQVSYYEQKTRRHIEGRSSGVSIRVARGVYYRTGAFRGHPVETTVNEHIATGVLAFTTKHVYFASPQKSFRIPYAKIVAFTPYSDGIGLQRDAMTAKPQVFVLGDGWFVYNLAMNLSQFSAQS